jgi:hypothetical protein
MLKTRKPPVEVETAKNIMDWLTWTIGVRGVDLNRLAARDAQAALGLLQKAEVESKNRDVRGGLEWGRLDEKEQARLEGFIARAAGLDADVFAKTREEHRLKNELNQILADGRRHEQMLRSEVRDCFSILYGYVESGHLWFEHAGLIVLLFAAFQSGNPLGDRQRFEGSGDDLTLVFDHRFGLLGGRVDPNGRAGNWKRVLDHLVKHRWFTLERRGPEWRLKLGPRSLATLRGTSVKKKTARRKAEA